MAMNSDMSQRAHLALAIIDDLGPDGESFVRRWMGFNAFYNAFVGTERDRLMAAVSSGLTNEQAANIMYACQSAIAYFASLPPGDMRRVPTDPNFRKRATLDMQAALNQSLPATESLAHLVAVVYQVRCNLFHGDKNPRLERDRRLIRASNSIIREVVDQLLVNARAA